MSAKWMQRHAYIKVQKCRRVGEWIWLERDT